MSDPSTDPTLRRNERIRIAIALPLMVIGFVILPFIFMGAVGVLFLNWLARAVLRRWVADGERFLKSWRGMLASAALTGCFILVAMFAFMSLLLAAGRERGRSERGNCPTYESFAAFFEQHHAPIHDGALSQLPQNARDIRYWFRAHGGTFEFRFPLDEDEFIAWAEGLGWTREAILARHRGGSTTLYDTDSEVGFQTLDFAKGFQLDSYGPGNRRCRSICYDEESGVVYLQFETPLPKELSNELIFERVP